VGVIEASKKKNGQFSPLRLGEADDRFSNFGERAHITRLPRSTQNSSPNFLHNEAIRGGMEARNQFGGGSPSDAPAFSAFVLHSGLRSDFDRNNSSEIFFMAVAVIEAVAPIRKNPIPSGTAHCRSILLWEITMNPQTKATAAAG